MNKKATIFILFVLIVMTTTLTACDMSSVTNIWATATPTPTFTPTPTLTPTETETPSPTLTPTSTLTPTETETPSPTLTPTETLTPTLTPTATATPTVGEILTKLGFTRKSMLESHCMCKGYLLVTGIPNNDKPGKLQALEYNSGAFEIIYVSTINTTTIETNVAYLDIATKAIREIYGDTIAQWMETIDVDFARYADTRSHVIDGHGVRVSSGQVDSETILVMLIVSPDTSLPALFNP